MRVTVFSASYPPVRCGVGDYARQLADALAGGGHRVTVVTSTRSRALEGDRTQLLAVLRHWNVSEYARRLPRLRRLRPDVVVSLYPAVLPSRYARLLYLLPALARLTLRRPRVIFVVHEFASTHAKAQRHLALAFRFADDIVAVTEQDARAIEARHPFAAGRTRLIPIGSNIPRIDADEVELARVRGRLAPAGERVLLAFGLVNPDKGIEDLLAALREQPDDIVLAMTGELREEDPYHAGIAAAIAEAGLGGRVRLLGHLDDGDAARSLQAADLVVLPFATGARANSGSLLAALSNGAAVLTTRGERTPEWLRDGENALLVEPGSPTSLARAIDRALRSPALRERLRAGARESPGGLDWSQIARRLLEPPRARR